MLRAARALYPNRPLERMSDVWTVSITSNQFLSLPFMISFIFLLACNEEKELRKESRTSSNPVLTSQANAQLSRGHWLLACAICLDGGDLLLGVFSSCNYHQCLGAGGWRNIPCKHTFIQQQRRNTHKTLWVLPKARTRAALWLTLPILESNCRFLVPQFPHV